MAIFYQSVNRSGARHAVFGARLGGLKKYPGFYSRALA